MHARPLLVALSCAPLAFTLLGSQPERVDRPQRQGDRVQPQRVQPGRGQPADPEQIVDRLMANDANGDGKLSKDELPERQARLFDRVDGNGDGFITPEEIKASFANRGGPSGPRPGGEGEAPSFAGHMSNLNGAMRSFRRSPLDASSMAEDLRQVNAIQAALVGAKAHLADAPVAPQAESRYADDDAVRAAMREQLIECTRDALDLELAIAKGEADRARELLDKLGGAQRAGHGVFKP